MNRTTKWVAGGTLALAAIGGGTGIAIANGAGDNDAPLEGSTLDKAVAAALASTGDVLETEVGDDGSAYGVEIRLEDGSQVEVNLDSSFAVINSGPDHDSPEERGGSETS